MPLHLPLMKSLRTLHVGAGGRGRWWLQETVKHNGFQPVGIVDPMAASLRMVKKECHGIDLPAFDSVKEAAKTVEADIAIVAAAATARVENCTEAIKAGMHILVEKPFALTLADGRRIVE